MSGERPWRPIDVAILLFWHRVSKLLHPRWHAIYCACGEAARKARGLG